jgi:hypothetical protein
MKEAALTSGLCGSFWFALWTIGYITQTVKETIKWNDNNQSTE